jgi:acyl-[acyl-carrier-protein]-phospholipid O-acyltransferase/long-chain-fatty-acid--[acyl-carrier-protein] ligase
MNRSFWSLVIAQCQVFINDNAAKLMLFGLAPAVLLPEQSKLLKVVLAALVVLPFILLAPTVGWLADRYSKRDVLYYSQYLQMVALGLMLVAVWWHQLPVAVVAFFLLGIQCAIFSPAKQGIIKEVVGEQKLSTAVSRVEITAVLSILVGSLVGASLFDGYRACAATLEEAQKFPTELAWQAALFTTSVLALLSVLGWWLCSRIERTPAHSVEPWRLRMLTEHFDQLREAWSHRPIGLSMLGNGYFYALGGALFLSLSDVAEALSTAGGVGSSIRLGVFMFLLGGGMALGGVVVSRLTLHHFELGLVPFGALGMIVGLLALGTIPPQTNWYNLALFLMGFSGSMFVVPLNAYVQELVPPGQRGRLLSASLLLMNLISILAISFYAILSAAFKFPPPVQFLVYSATTLAVALAVILLLPARLLRFTIGLLARIFYRVEVFDVQRLPEKGGVLLLPNHISYVDAIMLQLACPRDIRFIVYEGIYQHPWLNWGLRLLRTIPISSKRAKSGIDAAVEALKNGEIVCVFPEGALTRTASLGRLNRGYELIARRAETPVQPVWLENLWGSIFSYYGGKYFFKWPRALPYHVYVYFGETLAYDGASPDVLRRRLYDLGERAFRARPELRGHVGGEAIKGLKHHFFRPVLVDAYQNKTLTGAMMLGVSMAFSRWLRRNIPEKRVGIVLPPGAGAAIANLACAFADKTPVNLNFTAGRAANESALRQAGICHLITAEALVEKIKDFPWPEHRHDVARILGGIPKAAILGWTALGMILPNRWFMALAGIPPAGGEEEAGLLFTSGSSGEPKGVVLSHQNIIANTAQCGAVFANVELGSLLGCLPIFHSFGCTVTFWWPIMGGPRVVTYPSPLDTPRLIEIIGQHKIGLMINTPTFLRNFLRRATPEQLRSLRFIVTGAEKLPLDLLRKFEEKFAVTVCEGYGMTEATPVVSTNLIDLPPSLEMPEGAIGRKIGSVGRLLPGMSPRIRDVETGRDVSLFESGMLWLRGANIFTGYLNEPERTAAVLQGGWYKTGDIGRLDEDGFLYIEGRMSRFSKIAGEMAPHGTIEQKIAAALAEGAKANGAVSEGAEEEALKHLVVMGVPDEAKGEALVILSTDEIDLNTLRPKLLEAGLPSLWIPRQVVRVQEIPTLASGKLDLRRCQDLALAGIQAR